MVETHVGKAKMSHEMKMTTWDVQFGLCFSEILSINDMTGCHSVCPNMRSGLFLRLLDCL